ncbi:MAG: DUF6328 family protein [Acidobacteria bacterium]|nr:DUF6328 family protein [Acidobacteriota bacterium]
MAQLKDKIQTVLDESRMLVLGSQMLVGFQYRSFMENGFESLPLTSQLLKLVGLFAMLTAVALLIAPSAYHRIVDRGEDTEELHSYATRLMIFALLPFALGIGIDLYVAAGRVFGRKIGLAAGLAATGTAIFFWYVLELLRRRERASEVGEAKKMDEQKEEEPDDGAKLKDKIRHVLTEARVVLPGAQALLGFQFVAVLMESFEKLPPTSKYVHLASLAMTALTVIFLMTPAAYHRIVEEGENTEHFHRFASRMVIAAMVPLALGICGDVYVVVLKVLDSQLISVVASLVILALFWELWFGLTLYRRTQRDHATP